MTADDESGLSVPARTRPKLLFVVNEAFFFMSHRLPVARAAQRAGFEVHVAAPGDHVWAPDAFSIDDVRKAGFAFHTIPLSRRGKNPFFEARTVLALCRLYRQLNPDLIHHLTVKPNLYGGLAARVSGIPAMVNAVTGLGQIFVADGADAAVMRRIVVWAYRLAAGHGNCRFIVQNAADGDRLVGSGAIDAARVALIRGSGVELDRFRPTAEPPGAVVIVLAARLIWEKGVAAFVEAARRVKGRRDNVRFVLVGATRASIDRAVPEQDLRRWHDEGLVEWWGRREDMPAVLGQSHIVCLPSIYGEGVPRILIEAAACGRACVTTDLPGCRDIVRDGENGLIVPPGDVDQLVDSLIRLIDDDELRRRLGRNGRDIVEAEFSEKRVVDGTLAVYGDLLGSAFSDAP